MDDSVSPDENAADDAGLPSHIALRDADEARAIGHGVHVGADQDDFRIFDTALIENI